ncbi:MAG: ABC transporter substrate-binding protein, partial [Campylobacterales bacterium]|nr:ABC transporter substrate-binding protein [Campylobacterales bacterium]
MNIFKTFFLFLIITATLSSSEIKNISLQLQWKYQFQFAGFIIAKEKGFYKEAGFDVDIKEWQNGINMVDEVINCKSDYAVSRSTSMIDISKGKGILYLAAIFQSSPLILLTDKSSGITTVKEFKEKKIMSTGDFNADTSILSMMFSQGINLKDFEVLKPS